MSERNSNGRDKRNVQQRESRKRVIFAFKLLAFVGLLFLQIRFPRIEENMPGVLRTLIFLITGHLVISLMRIIIAYFYMHRRKRLGKVERDNLLIAINRLASLCSFALVIASVFFLFDLSTQELLTNLSLFGVAMVLITKDYIASTINGMIIMFSDKLSINDYVRIGEHEGRIVDLTLSNVYLTNEADQTIIIPNNTVFVSDVINLTKKHGGNVSIPLEMPPSLAYDLGTLEETFVDIMKEYEHLIVKNSYLLEVKKVLIDKVQLEFQFTIRRPNMKEEYRLKRVFLRKALPRIIQHVV